MQNNGENVRVAVRIRPRQDNERESVISAKNGKITIAKVGDPKAYLESQKAKEYEYAFDEAFGPEDTQEFVYEKSTAPLILNVVQGTDATVFAYGASGAGKTYTMFGSVKDPGIVFRAISDLFNSCSQEKLGKGIKFEVKMSFIEIYCETIKDLLGFQKKKPVEISEDSKEVKVRNLTLVPCPDLETAWANLSGALKSRQVEATKVNKESSRSHAVLQLHLDKKYASKKATVPFSKLSMIDLAGSERASQTQNMGCRLKEASHINRSLLALANCVNALARQNATPEGKNGANGLNRVKYRDSKLTHILKNSMEGNCNLVMIANVNPASFEDSHNTLKYASRTKTIRIRTTEIRDKETESMESLVAALEQLKAENQCLQSECSFLKSRLCELPKEVQQTAEESIRNLSLENEKLKNQIALQTRPFSAVSEILATEAPKDNSANSEDPKSANSEDPKSAKSENPNSPNHQVLLAEALSQIQRLCGLMLKNVATHENVESSNRVSAKRKRSGTTTAVSDSESREDEAEEDCSKRVRKGKKK
eukprot:GHVP01015481.1.p2 GENE.GHVP01015481.1~~GHVP01015481.1.p2  ORF type:complete len:538 (+),score=107.84 GHVP01015481.1:2949-4562(+)